MEAGGLDDVEIGNGLSTPSCPTESWKQMDSLKHFYAPKANQIYTLRIQIEEIVLEGYFSKKQF